MLADDTADWTGMAATPAIDPADEGGLDDLDCPSPEPVETIILRRRTRLQGEADTLILIEIGRDLLRAFVVTRRAASAAHPARQIAIPCASWDEATVEAGARIHRALSAGYRLQRETAFSS